MKIEFGVFLKIRREPLDEEPEDIVSAFSTTASQIDLAEPDSPVDTRVRIGPRGRSRGSDTDPDHRRFYGGGG